MTRKRFRLGYVCGDFGLIDNAQSKGNQWTDLHSMSGNSEKNVQICINKMNELAEENEQLKQFKEKVASVIESKMGDNVCNDYKMQVLKEVWNELNLDEVWFE